jgi:hypothetical protein
VTSLLSEIAVGAVVYPLALTLFARGELRDMRAWIAEMRES